MSERPSYLQRMRHWPRFFARAETNPGHLYDLRGDAAVVTGGDTPVVNMGYWKDVAPREARSLERANEALFALVADGAGITAGSTVVDAGCGFGSLALHLVERFTPARMTGVNVSSVQLAIARQRVAAAGREGQVEFHHGSVTALPMADASVDAVVSTEAAFHFDTRDAFLAEAFRVLRPGGRLSLVDLVVLPPPSFLWHGALTAVARSQAIPRANVYDSAEYLRRVTRAGFVVEESESIHDRVFAPFRWWLLTRPPTYLLRYDVVFLAASLPFLVYPFDYLRLVARKP